VPALMHVHTTIKVLLRNMPDFIIAPNPWLLHISYFSPVDYRILAMLQDWVCQHPVRHTDKLMQCLIESQMLTDQAIDWWWFRLRASVMARRGHFKHL